MRHQESKKRESRNSHSSIF